MRNTSVSKIAGTGLFIAALSAFGLVPDVSHAQRGPRADRIIQMMDSDGDGRISRSEWLRRPGAFSRIDKDGDGYATADELSAFLKDRFGGGGSRRAAPSAPAAPTTAAYDIIDTHVHLGFGPRERDFAAGISEALTKMPKRHVALAVLLPVPQLGDMDYRYDQDDLRRVARSDGFRIAGGSGVFGRYLHNSGKSVSEQERRDFRALAQSLVDQGIVAFGEIGLYHLANPRAGNVFGRIPLDHPLLDVLGEVAARSGVPIDVHFDVVPRSLNLPPLLQGADNPSHLEANLAPFEQFLSRNAKTKIVWAHAGYEALPFRTAQLCETLLRGHDNLYMSIRLSRTGGKPSAAMDGNGHLKADWLHLFIAFPGRFVFGSESMYGSAQSRRFDKEFVLYQNLLAALPPPVARKIASSNARAIYQLGSNK